MTADELRDREIEAQTRSILTSGEAIGLTEALLHVMAAQDLADARGRIESTLSMTRLRRAGFDIEAQHARDDLRILKERAELDAATKRLDARMVAAGVIERDAVERWDVVE